MFFYVIFLKEELMVLPFLEQEEQLVLPFLEQEEQLVLPFLEQEEQLVLPSRRPSGLRKTRPDNNSLAHRTSSLSPFYNII